MRQSFGLLFADPDDDHAVKAAVPPRLGRQLSHAKVDLVLGGTATCGLLLQRSDGRGDPVLDKHFWRLPGTPRLHYPLDDQLLTFLPGTPRARPELDGVRVRGLAPTFHPSRPTAPVTVPPSPTPVRCSRRQPDDPRWTAASSDSGTCALRRATARTWSRQALCAASDAFFTTAFDVAQVIECGRTSASAATPFKTVVTSAPPGSGTFRDGGHGERSRRRTGGGRAGGRSLRTGHRARPVLQGEDRERSRLRHRSEGEWSNPRVDRPQTTTTTRWARTGMGPPRPPGRGRRSRPLPATGAERGSTSRSNPSTSVTIPRSAPPSARSCTATSECGAGLTCTLGSCRRTRSPRVDGSRGRRAGPATARPGASSSTSASPRSPSGVEQCTADASAKAGDVCRQRGDAASPLAKVRVTVRHDERVLHTGSPRSYRAANEQGACSKPFSQAPEEEHGLPEEVTRSGPLPPVRSSTARGAGSRAGSARRGRGALRLPGRGRAADRPRSGSSPRSPGAWRRKPPPSSESASREGGGCDPPGSSRPVGAMIVRRSREGEAPGNRNLRVGQSNLATGHTNSRASTAQQSFPFPSSTRHSWTRAGHERTMRGETWGRASAAGPPSPASRCPTRPRLKKLARYRSMLELSLQRRLAPWSSSASSPSPTWPARRTRRRPGSTG